jgi:hypothetical protein
MAIGVTGAVHMIDGDGTETTRESGELNKGTLDEDVVVPEVFIEAIADNGFAIGVSYIPTRELGSKSRTDAESPGDTDSDDGTYTAKAELENVIQIYTDIPTGSIGSFPIHVKLGVSHVTVATQESLNSGSSYPNRDILGATIGLGTKGDIPYGNNLFYKGEVTYTNFETFEATSAGNKVTADLEDIAAKLSIGYKF